MHSIEKPSGEIIKSDENPEVSGEINTPATETEIAVDLEGRHTVEEWLVFVEEEIGPVKEVIKDEIKNNYPKSDIPLQKFADLLAKTMGEKKYIDMNILNRLAKLDKMAGKY